jgi:hypothetical protein
MNEKEDKVAKDEGLKWKGEQVHSARELWFRRMMKSRRVQALACAPPPP